MPPAPRKEGIPSEGLEGPEGWLVGPLIHSPSGAWRAEGRQCQHPAALSLASQTDTVHHSRAQWQRWARPWKERPLKWQELNAEKSCQALGRRAGSPREWAVQKQSLEFTADGWGAGQGPGQNRTASCPTPPLQRWDTGAWTGHTHLPRTHCGVVARNLGFFASARAGRPAITVGSTAGG